MRQMIRNALCLTLALQCAMPLHAARAASIKDGQNEYVLKSASGQQLAYIPGIYSGIFIHELGHTVTPLIFLGYPTKFKPWPHKKGGQLQMGAVEWWIPWPWHKFSAPFIQFAGFGFNMAGSFAAAFFIPKASNIYLREFLIASAYTNAIYFPLYIITDVIFKNKYSDFDKLKSQIGMGRGWFLLPSLAAGAGLCYFTWKKQNTKPANGVIAQTIPLGSAGIAASTLTSIPVIQTSWETRGNPTSLSVGADPFSGTGNISFHLGF